MLNRRKAMIGWLVYSAAKPMAKRAVQGQGKKSTRKSGSNSAKQSKGGTGRVVAGIGAAAAVAGGLLFWRSRRANDDDVPPDDLPPDDLPPT
jgi:hypothetical protein